MDGEGDATDNADTSVEFQEEGSTVSTSVSDAGEYNFMYIIE